MRTEAGPKDLPTVLLAEKDESPRRLFGVLLAEEGYRVIGVGTRAEVLELLRTTPRLDLVIADRGLPGMPAWDIVQETAWCRPGVPCVRLVESPSDAQPAHGANSPVEAMLQRPVTIVDLLVTMESLLARATSERQLTNQVK